MAWSRPGTPGAELDHQVAGARPCPTQAAVKQVVRLLLQHSGDGPTDDVPLSSANPSRP
jgi:hypothetical protein